MVFIGFQVIYIFFVDRLSIYRQIILFQVFSHQAPGFQYLFGKGCFSPGCRLVLPDISPGLLPGNLPFRSRQTAWGPVYTWICPLRSTTGTDGSPVFRTFSGRYGYPPYPAGWEPFRHSIDTNGGFLREGYFDLTHRKSRKWPCEWVVLLVFYFKKSYYCLMKMEEVINC